MIGRWRLVFPDYGAPNRTQRDLAATFALKLAMDDRQLWFSECGGVIVGSVMAGYDGDRGRLYSLGVSPPAGGQGIGRVLAARAKYALTALSCPKIDL